MPVRGPAAIQQSESQSEDFPFLIFHFSFFIELMGRVARQDR
jgi:hypothetical protein